MRIYKGPMEPNNTFHNFTWPNAKVGQELYDSDVYEIVYQD